MARGTWRGLLLLAGLTVGLYLHPSAVIAVRSPRPAGQPQAQRGEAVAAPVAAPVASKLERPGASRPEVAFETDEGAPFEALLFWLCALVLSYTYVGYPALVFAWGRLAARPFRARPTEPSVSVVLVAHNEADRIRARLANLLSLDYPEDRLEILVGSDGSDDGTAEQVAACDAAKVRLFVFGRRRGKAAVVNDLVARTRGEIVVLADARQEWSHGALRALVAPFADSTVGAVSGELVLLPGSQASATGEGVGLYWRYEKLIRRSESRVDSSVGATGAIYAIRRALFERIPDDTVLDDVLIPFNVVRQGYRVLFEPGARAYDRAASNPGDEFRRKVRTIAGTFQLFARQPWLLNPLRNRLWFQTVSHKALRLTTPFALAGALGSNLLLLDSGPYLGLLGAQLAFYAAALVGRSLQKTSGKLPFVSVPYVVCLLSWATLVALGRFVSGRQSVTWERVPAR
jgi:cellulose synthase/poly-beta-1,6-N-acetylglucosamine synthase-like glycosyltransferase